MSHPSSVPLCVDLDGTLVRGDLLAESVVRLVARHPLQALRLPLWLLRGRAALKREVARRVTIDPATLPYNRELLEHLTAERRAGRRLLLVTAADEGPARAVAEHVALFDEVLATDGRVNLKGATKRRALVERFGEGGFDYAGNAAADLEVWPAAREALVVRAPRHVERRAAAGQARVFDRPRRGRLRAVLDVIRVRQWVKNLLVVLPVLLAHRYTELPLLAEAGAAFLAFSLTASAVYVLNDLTDVEADRQHPVKRRRPFASGELPLALGAVLAPTLLAAAAAVAWLLPPTFGGLLLLYLGVTTAYSMVLKTIALVDVLVLAGLYTLRIIAGSAATGVETSEWLLALSMFLFLSLGAVKRFAEVRRTAERAADGAARVSRRGYFAADRDLLRQIGISAGCTAVLVLALYITSDHVRDFYALPQALWAVCVLLLYWIARVWLLADRGRIQDDPLTFAVRDRVTWAVAAIAGIVVLVAGRGLA